MKHIGVNASSTPLLVTEIEAARMLSCSVSHVRRQPFARVRMGRRCVRFLYQSVVDHIAQHTVKAVGTA